MKPTAKEIELEARGPKQPGWFQGETKTEMNWKMHSSGKWIVYENGQVGKPKTWQVRMWKEECESKREYLAGFDAAGRQTDPRWM